MSLHLFYKARLIKDKLSILLRKIRTVCLLILTPFAVPLVLVIRLLRPIIIIRFGALRSERLGHYAINTELYLCQRDTGKHSKKNFDIFFHASEICNYQLKKMWDRTLYVSQIARPLDRANRLLPGYQLHTVPLSTDRDVEGLLEDTQPHLTFTDHEKYLGRKELLNLGINEHTPFICFSARDPIYLCTNYSNQDWSYHNFRNSHINSYLPAVQEMAKRGYFGIRMGALTKSAIHSSEVKIIDYAWYNRNDFLDVFLSAYCKFFIIDSQGLSALPWLFRRPIVWTNYIPLEHIPSWRKNDLFIPKKLWLKKEQRFMTFKETLDSGAGRFLKQEDYERANIDVIENTPQEILALAIEMEERLSGAWVSSPENEELQKYFWSLFKPNDLNTIFRLRIGSLFLQENINLLK